MFINLDTLPFDRALYTVYVTCDPEGTARSEMTCDEVDVVAKRGAGWGDVCNEGQELRDYADAANHRPAINWMAESYGDDMRIIGVVNQSDGFVVFDAFAAGIETGANDMGA